MILERFVSFVCFLLIRVCLSQRHLKKNLFNSTAISCSQVVEIVTAFLSRKSIISGVVDTCSTVQKD